MAVMVLPLMSDQEPVPVADSWSLAVRLPPAVTLPTWTTKRARRNLARSTPPLPVLALALLSVCGCTCGAAMDRPWESCSVNMEGPGGVVEPGVSVQGDERRHGRAGVLEGD